MLVIRMTDCAQCGDILVLISGIDCRVTEIGNDIYNDLIYALNKTCKIGDMGDLIHYRRILVSKWCNSEYADDFSVLQIASKVQLMVAGCVPQECCDECLFDNCDFAAGLGGEVDRVAIECDYEGGTVDRI